MAFAGKLEGNENKVWIKYSGMRDIPFVVSSQAFRGYFFLLKYR